MGTLGAALAPLHGPSQPEPINDTTIISSEFSRRISENGSGGTDHGAAGLMMVLGGSVRGGSTAPRRHSRQQPDARERLWRRPLRNRFPIRHARLLDSWLGVNSVPILSEIFAGAPAIF
jgi:uncharacterized protein (DUF1501 family)